MLVRDFGPNRIMFIMCVCVCVVITVAIVILLRDFGSDCMTLTTSCVYCLNFPIILDGQFSINL
jgi:hypothetical protein